MRAIVFVNGIVPDYEAMSRWIEPDDYLICADGGVAHCLAIGRQPDLVVGDMDSITRETLAQLESAGAELERYPRSKNQTDLELALERALRDGADDVLILGALGGRLDQTLANLLILAQRDWPVPVLIAEGNQVAEALHGGETVELIGEQGSVVSLIPLSHEVAGISYTGLEYSLTDAALSLGSTRAVSNLVKESPASISIETGVALIVQTIEDSGSAPT